MTNTLLEQASSFLSNLNVLWAFCGGYALDLFLDREIRKHGDIDICVFEEDRNRIQNYMMSNEWTVYQFLGGGRVRSLGIGDKSAPNRNLMCVKEGCDLVKFFPSEEGGVFGYEFYHTGIERLDYLEFLFNHAQDDRFIFNRELNLTRDMQKAFLYHNGLPYIAPELALLYKASNADDPAYQYDYEMTISHLNDEQLCWFQDGLEKLYPKGHSWRI